MHSTFINTHQFMTFASVFTIIHAYVHTSMYTSICLCAYSHLCSHLILSVQKKKKKNRRADQTKMQMWQ